MIEILYLDQIIFEISTPVEKFLSFYERSKNLNFSGYFIEIFENQSPIKHQVKYHNHKEEQYYNEVKDMDV